MFLYLQFYLETFCEEIGATSKCVTSGEAEKCFGLDAS